MCMSVHHSVYVYHVRRVVLRLIVIALELLPALVFVTLLILIIKGSWTGVYIILGILFSIVLNKFETVVDLL
jgi:hypothetical protein